VHGQRQSVPRIVGSIGDGIKLRVGEGDKRNIEEMCFLWRSAPKCKALWGDEDSMFHAGTLY